MERTRHRDSLGSNYLEELDESGPGYAIRAGSDIVAEKHPGNSEQQKMSR